MAANIIGMSVPGASDLGLGGMLQDQVGLDTEEQRKKKLAAMEAAKLSGGGVGASSLGLGSTGYGAGLPGSI